MNSLLQRLTSQPLQSGLTPVRSKASPFALSGLFALLILGVSPLSMSANAQVFSSQRSTTAQPSTRPTATAQTPNQTSQQSVLDTKLRRDETLYLDKREAHDYDLVLKNVSSLNGRQLPIGTLIRGRFEPSDGGLVYVANAIEIDNQIFSISARSDLLTERKDPRQTSTGAVLGDAAIGAVGGYVLGEVFGRPDIWEVAGGAAAGVLVGRTTAPSVVVVKPDDVIALYADRTI
ncbi:hypothetical protein S7335_4293 [Synechococcus sp. PCC 7335]|uniref:hypothetical protein n=1 Tax=Synechococcus sp. (strain ATCC 29403 / PCC 7335) TaxID=91464 RepID=UPI00017EB144|nr:hypothetical protein [Synechococcus sp. PCC 7335]EDX86588.1 hypothetical protein S7335_4293 [Synechococcus sp. PCC 7335]